MPDLFKKVKVCGVRDQSQLKVLSALAPDYLGFILIPSSRRYIHPSAIRFEEVAKGIGIVAVVRDVSEEELITLLDTYPFSAVQFHGSETPDYCERIKEKFPNRIILKTISNKQFDNFDAIQRYRNCDYLLFDNGDGGTGKCFDWSMLHQYKGTVPFFIAGGVGTHNLEALFLSCHHALWQGIDVNSRVEFSPGVKNPDAVRNIMNRVRE
jgi:phosphoribosylanthranilate isomerase